MPANLNVARNGKRALRLALQSLGLRSVYQLKKYMCITTGEAPAISYTGISKLPKGALVYSTTGAVAQKVFINAVNVTATTAGSFTNVTTSFV